jgi:hypothetical protein
MPAMHEGAVHAKATGSTKRARGKVTRILGLAEPIAGISGNRFHEKAGRWWISVESNKICLLGLAVSLE